MQSSRSLKKHQRGATLVVVLVILVAMTFLGLGAMNDNSLQVSMVRNSQLQTGAYTAALTEINAQLDVINNNNANQVDQIILNLVQTNTTTDDEGVASRSIDVTALEGQVSLELDNILGDEFEHYETSLSLEEPNAGVYLPVEGMSISPESTVKFLVMEFQSSARIQNTSTSSNQVQGFKYLSAN